MTTTNSDLVAEVRQVLDAARQAGEPAPGRPTLVRRTGATDHAVRTALAQIAAENTGVGASDPDPSCQEAPAQVGGAPDGRFVAWVGFVFGSVTSIAANVLHTWLPAATSPPGWSPPLAAQVGATVWPVGLLLSVEVLCRVRWPRAWLWSLARLAGTTTVALGSAMISYSNLREVLLAWHYNALAATVGPLVLDGLMTLCGLALLASGRRSGRSVDDG